MGLKPELAATNTGAADMNSFDSVQLPTARQMATIVYGVQHSINVTTTGKVIIET